MGLRRIHFCFFSSVDKILLCLERHIIRKLFATLGLFTLLLINYDDHYKILLTHLNSRSSTELVTTVLSMFYKNLFVSLLYARIYLHGLHITLHSIDAVLLMF